MADTDECSVIFLLFTLIIVLISSCHFFFFFFKSEWGRKCTGFIGPECMAMGKSLHLFEFPHPEMGLITVSSAVDWWVF